MEAVDRKKEACEAYVTTPNQFKRCSYQSQAPHQAEEMWGVYGCQVFLWSV